MGYAFISYSTKNQAMADSMRQLLRQNSIESWMAPADIPAGSKYAQVITRAIKECTCVVLMLSEASQNSTWVAKEIERAVNYRKVIIPVQLEDLVLNEEFEFYISTDQIVAVKQIDRDSPEIQKVLAQLRLLCGSANDCTPQENAPAIQSASAPSEDSQAYCEKGEQYYVEKQWDKAVEWYRKAAVLGHAEAQRSLAICYYAGGNGIAQDYSQAVTWARKAAEQKDAQGYEILGNCYYYGHGIGQDYEQAVNCYKVSAEAGRTIGMVCLGNCYDRGHGVEQDYQKAAALYRLAAILGDAEALYHLGRYYMVGLGVEKDIKQAATYFGKAAEKGHVDALVCCGTISYSLNEKDAAKTLYQAAAAQGNVLAQALLKDLFNE